MERDASGYLRSTQLDTHAARTADNLARDRSWESYRTIVRFISNTTHAADT